MIKHKSFDFYQAELKKLADGQHIDTYMLENYVTEVTEILRAKEKGLKILQAEGEKPEKAVLDNQKKYQQLLSDLTQAHTKKKST